VVACKEVMSEDEVMIVTQNGVLIRTEVDGISTVGRNTQGVRVINLGEGDRVIDMTRVPKGEDDAEIEAGEAVESGDEAAAEGASEAAEQSGETPSETGE